MILIREISKALLLFVLIIIGIILYSMEEPVEAKANRIIQNKLSLHDNLTREERDQYMLYLRSLNAETNDSIYLIEVP
jgi:hypothetical protein